MGLDNERIDEPHILLDDSSIRVEAETNAPVAPEDGDAGYTRVVIRNGGRSDWMVMVQGGRTIVDCAESGRKTVDVPETLELRFYGGANAADMAAAFTNIGLDLARHVTANRVLLPGETFQAAGPVDGLKPSTFFRPSGEIRLEVMAKTRAGIKRAATIGTLAAATAAVVHAQSGCVAPGGAPIPQTPGAAGGAGSASATTTGGASTPVGGAATTGGAAGSSGASTGGSSSIPPPIGGTTGSIPETPAYPSPPVQDLIPTESVPAGAAPGVQPLVVVTQPTAPAQPGASSAQPTQAPASVPAAEMSRPTIDVSRSPAVPPTRNSAAPPPPALPPPALPPPALPPPALPPVGATLTPSGAGARPTIALSPSGDSQAAPVETSLAAPVNRTAQGKSGGRLRHRQSRAPGGLAQTGGDPVSYSLFGISLSGIMAALRRGPGRRRS